MTQDTKNKFAEIFKAANEKANIPATAKKPQEIEVNDTVKYKGAAITAKVTNISKDFTDTANITFEDVKKEQAYIEDLQKVELSNITFDDLVNSEPSKDTQKPSLTLVNYSDKSFAVIGDTYQVKDVLKAMGGKFNYNLTCGAGWIFPVKKAYTVRKALNLVL